jgi:predicted MPP superfamily phosphohydrolase
MKRRSFIKTAAVFAAAPLVVQRAVHAAENPAKKLTLVQLCDPQLGFGADGFDADVVRLKQEIKQVNKLAPDVAVFAGDMVNDCKDEHAVKTFLELIAEIKVPVILTPGNHDLHDPVTAENLERYRADFGQDYFIKEYNGIRIISANSQLWRQSPPDESQRHDQFVLNSLKNTATIMLTHVPPFVKSVDEKDAYFNLPTAKRNKLLRLCNENGVTIWLAGHTHTTLKRSFGNVTILNGETTSRNFDKRPFGFRLLTLYADSHFDWEFQELK